MPTSDPIKRDAKPAAVTPEEAANAAQASKVEEKRELTDAEADSVRGGNTVHFLKN